MALCNASNIVVGQVDELVAREVEEEMHASVAFSLLAVRSPHLGAISNYWLPHHLSKHDFDDDSRVQGFVQISNADVGVEEEVA